MSDAGGAGHVVTRRAALALGALAVGLLPGCGLRLEDDAPRVPLVPRRPYPGADALRAAHERSAAAARAARGALGVGGLDAANARTAATAVDLDEARAAALAARLEEVGEPAPATADPTLAPSGTAGPAGTAGTAGTTSPTSRPVTPAQAWQRAVAAQGAGLDDAGRAALAQVPADDLVLLGGIHVARTAGARALRARTASTPRRPAPPDGGATTELLEGVRAAMYGLEVAAAQAAPARRPVATSSLGGLRRMRGALESAAGSAAPEPELGYELPFPVTTPAAADRLARRMLTAVADDCVRLLPASAGHREPIVTLLAWAADAETWRHAWGAPLRARAAG